MGLKSLPASPASSSPTDVRPPRPRRSCAGARPRSRRPSSGTLADIAVRAARALEPPVVVVVGDVVALRDRLQWFDDNHVLMEIAQ